MKANGIFAPNVTSEKTMTDYAGHIRLIVEQSDNRVWFWKPSWHWFGWETLLPIGLGHDELARRTLVLGWTFTGRVIIPLGDCGSEDCRREAIADIYRGRDDDD